MRNLLFTLSLFTLFLLIQSCDRMVNKAEVTVSDPALSTTEDPKPDPAPVPEPEKGKSPVLDDMSHSSSPEPEMLYKKPAGKEFKLERKSDGSVSYDYYNGSSPAPSYYMSTGEGSVGSYSEKYSSGFGSESYKNSIANAGILTAGELHDFSKWDLWTDIATDALGAYQRAWSIRPMERYGAQVTTNKGKPVIDAEVELLSGDNVIWSAKTDNTGKAELWADMYEKKEYIKAPEYKLRVKYQGKTLSQSASPFGPNGLNHFVFSTACDVPNTVDAMFVVDVTGSMGDEISYLKSELNSIIGKFKQQNESLNLRIGSVFYRDLSDEYLTRESDFSDDPFKTVDFIQNQVANGGGDFPEAVDAALDAAMKMNWSPTARTRLLFLVLDAPPHETPEVKASLWKSIDKAAKMGIRIIPVTASGIDKSTEYLMRSFALATNGTYVFLTNNSGVGGDHIVPTTDSYDVEKLNDLLLRLFTQFTYAPDCKDDLSILKRPDTSRIYTVLTNVPGDTTVQQYVLSDTNANYNPIEIHDTASNINQIDPPKEEALVYYPNPTRGVLNVEVMKDMKEVYLADVSGKLIDKYTVGEQQRLQIRLDNFPTGMYFLKCEVNGRWLSGKVVLVRN
jgi:hypothetical protein